MCLVRGSSDGGGRVNYKASDRLTRAYAGLRKKRNFLRNRISFHKHLGAAWWSCMQTRILAPCVYSLLLTYFNTVEPAQRVRS